MILAWACPFNLLTEASANSIVTIQVNLNLVNVSACSHDLSLSRTRPELQKHSIYGYPSVLVQKPKKICEPPHTKLSSWYRESATPTGENYSLSNDM